MNEDYSNYHKDILQIKSDLQGKQKSIDATLNIPQEEWEEKLTESTNIQDTLFKKLEQLIAINNEKSPEIKMNRLLLFSEGFDSIDLISQIHGGELQMWFENLEELKTFLNEYEVSLFEEKKRRKYIDTYLK